MTNKKVILVVGASRGIGSALVRLFASNTEHTVLALSRNVKAMKTNFSNFENVICVEFDLEKNVEYQLSSILSHHERVDILVNNAGLLIKKAFLELTQADIEKSYRINVFGVMETVKSVVPKMTEMGGHIVNISSMGGFQGSVKFPGLSAYSTSKAAICSFTELFAEEFKDSTIKMNCLCLGAAQTEMLQEAFPGYEAPLSANKMAEYIWQFALYGNQWMNGKILPVSLSTP